MLGFQTEPITSIEYHTSCPSVVVQKMPRIKVDTRFRGVYLHEPPALGFTNSRSQIQGILFFIYHIRVIVSPSLYPVYSGTNPGWMGKIHGCSKDAFDLPCGNAIIVGGNIMICMQVQFMIQRISKANAF